MVSLMLGIDAIYRQLLHPDLQGLACEGSRCAAVLLAGGL
jgi:hypothetical protein